jgi:hypothetical protein
MTISNKGFKDIAEVKLEFQGVDRWNRPIWKVPGHKIYFGSTGCLYNDDATEEDISVSLSDIEYFGTSFGCEPEGGMNLGISNKFSIAGEAGAIEVVRIVL